MAGLWRRHNAHHRRACPFCAARAGIYVKSAEETHSVSTEMASIQLVCSSAKRVLGKRSWPFGPTSEDEKLNLDEKGLKATRLWDEERRPSVVFGEKPVR